jgi:hypothetical protein
MGLEKNRPSGTVLCESTNSPGGLFMNKDKTVRKNKKQNILVPRHRNNGLLLNELGDQLLGGEHEQRGQNGSRAIMRSKSWTSKLIEEYLWKQGDNSRVEHTVNGWIRFRYPEQFARGFSRNFFSPNATNN